jgi:hypothetical protein
MTKTSMRRPSSLAHTPRRALATSLAASLALAACGGGGDAADGAAATHARPMNGVGSGGTGKSVSVGPVKYSGTTTTMTSATSRAAAAAATITVNGVTYADSTATITDDLGRSRTLADLLAGTSVVLTAGPTASSASLPVASTIQITSDLLGTTDAAFDAGLNTLRVMGQPVLVNTGTALDGVPGGLGALPAGAVVEVASAYDPVTGNYIATRIDSRAATAVFKARGNAAAVDIKAHTFRIGTQVFNYTAVSSAKVAEGQAVDVALQTARNASGQWVVTQFLASTLVVADSTNLGLTGVASSVSDATHFVVSGTAVDSSHATVQPSGAVVGVQSRVELQGVMTAGVLVASRVTVKARGDTDDGNTTSGHPLGRAWGQVLPLAWVQARGKT